MPQIGVCVRKFRREVSRHPSGRRLVYLLFSSKTQLVFPLTTLEGGKFYSLCGIWKVTGSP